MRREPNGYLPLIRGKNHEANLEIKDWTRLCFKTVRKTALASRFRESRGITTAGLAGSGTKPRTGKDVVNGQPFCVGQWFFVVLAWHGRFPGIASHRN